MNTLNHSFISCACLVHKGALPKHLQWAKKVKHLCDEHEKDGDYLFVWSQVSKEFITILEQGLCCHNQQSYYFLYQKDNSVATLGHWNNNHFGLRRIQYIDCDIPYTI